MHKPIVACLVLLFVQGLSGCSRYLQVMLLNGTDTAVTLQLFRRSLAIEPGRSATFVYPQQPEGWTIHLSAAQRDYVYEVPRSLDHYLWQPDDPRPLKAQLDRDFAIYLLPRDAAAVADVSRFAGLQQDGFPLHPQARE